MIEEFSGKIKLVIKFFPHPYKEYSKIAALAAIEAEKQGKFREMHFLLLERSPFLDRDSLVMYATQLNLDVKKFINAIDNKEGSDIIERDLKLARELDIYGTPTFFINGIKVQGAREYEYFREIILKELARQKR